MKPSGKRRVDKRRLQTKSRKLNSLRVKGKTTHNPRAAEAVPDNKVKPGSQVRILRPVARRLVATRPGNERVSRFG